MKTGDILLETQQEVVENGLDFNDLSSIQIGALRAIHDERLDFDNASDRMLDVIYSLQDFNLVDELFELTPMGRRAVQIALEIGGAERRKAAFRASMKNQDIESDEDIYGTEYPNDNEHYGGGNGNWSVYQGNRFGSINNNL